MSSSESLSSEDQDEGLAIWVTVLSLVSGGGSPYPHWAFPGEAEPLASDLNQTSYSAPSSLGRSDFSYG